MLPAQAFNVPVDAATAKQQLAAADLAHVTCNERHDYGFDAFQLAWTECRPTSPTINRKS